MADANMTGGDQLAATLKELQGLQLPGNFTKEQPGASNSMLDQIMRLPANTARIVSAFLARSQPQLGALPADAPSILPAAPAQKPGPGALPAPAKGKPKGAMRQPEPMPDAPQQAVPELNIGNAGALPDFSQMETPAPAPARASLPDVYRQEMSKVDSKVSDQLNPQQADAARRMFYATLLEGAGRPAGTRGATNPFGAAARQSQEYADRQQAINRAMEMARVQAQRGDAAAITNLTDKEGDNARMDRSQEETGRHNRASEGDARERLKIMREQLEQGNFKLMPGKSGNYMLYNTKTGQSKDTGLAVDRGDTRPAEVKLLEYLQKNPKAMETYTAMRGKPDGMSEKDIVSQGVELSKAQLGMGGEADPGEVLRRNIEAVRAATGRGGNALPPGIPEGSKPIGKAKEGPNAGKTVYQTPDGKKVIAQ